MCKKITSAENLRSRAFDDLAIELNINCNRKNTEVIFLTLLNYADYEELLNLISKASQIVVTYT